MNVEGISDPARGLGWASHKPYDERGGRIRSMRWVAWDQLRNCRESGARDLTVRLERALRADLALVHAYLPVTGGARCAGLDYRSRGFSKLDDLD